MKNNKIQCGIVLLLCIFLLFGPFVSIALAYDTLEKRTNAGRVTHSGERTFTTFETQFTVKGDAHAIIEWSFSCINQNATFSVVASLYGSDVLGYFFGSAEGVYHVQAMGHWSITFVLHADKPDVSIIIQYKVTFDGDLLSAILPIIVITLIIGVVFSITAFVTVHFMNKSKIKKKLITQIEGQQINKEQLKKIIKASVVYKNKKYNVKYKKGTMTLNLSKRDIKDINDIKGLDSLIYLKKLDLGNNQITSIAGLEKLTRLEVLNLSFNQIQEIKGLETLANLKELHLNNNQIKEIKGLTNLSNLEQINLSNNQIPEIKGLENLVQLKSLDLSVNQINELPVLSYLNNLEKFRFDGNPAYDALKPKFYVLYDEKLAKYGKKSVEEREEMEKEEVARKEEEKYHVPKDADPKLVRYCDHCKQEVVMVKKYNTAFIIFVLCCTGIIPGIIAILLYVALKDADTCPLCNQKQYLRAVLPQDRQAPDKKMCSECKGWMPLENTFCPYCGKPQIEQEKIEVAKNWFDEGAKQASTGQHEEAIKSYNKALETNPWDYDTWEKKGISLFELGRYQDAILAFDEGLKSPSKKSTSSATSWFYKGNAFYAISDFDTAIKCYDEAIRLFPYKWESFSSKGLAQVALGNYKDAIKSYDTTLLYSSNDSSTMARKSEAYLHLIEYNKALKWANKAIKADPKNATAWTAKARALQALGKQDEALNCCETALKLNPNDASVLTLKKKLLNQS